MLKKEMPIFEESAVLSYRESSKVENLEYIDEGSDEKKFMKMDQTIWFDSVNQDQTQADLLASEVNIHNIAALGAWQSITTMNKSRIASGAFSGMMSTLNKDNAAVYYPLSISVHNMFIPDETKFMTVIDSVKDLTPETKGQLWSHLYLWLGSALGFFPALLVRYLAPCDGALLWLTSKSPYVLALRPT